MAELSKEMQECLKEFNAAVGNIPTPVAQEIAKFAAENPDKVLNLFKAEEAAVMKTRPFPTQAQAYVDNHTWTAYPSALVKVNAVYETGRNAFRLGSWLVGLARGTI